MKFRDIRSTRLVPVLLSPFFISLGITCILIILVPLKFSRFRIKLLEETTYKYEKLIYSDLDSDSISERFECRTYGNPPSPCIEFFDSDGNYFATWNLPGNWPADNKVMTGDYDNDLLKEVYVLMIRNDSIFLCGVEPNRSEEDLFEPKYIAICRKYNDANQFTIKPGEVTDLNNDGYGEVVFAINAGFTLQPRGVYAYDIHNDSLLKSPESFAALRGLELADIDSDGLKEMILSSAASSNCDITGVYPFNDNSSWLQVLDNDMSFMFGPVEFPYKSSIIQVKPAIIHDTVRLAIFGFIYNNNNFPPFIALFDLKGREIRKRDIPDGFGGAFWTPMPGILDPDDLILTTMEATYLIGENLELRKITGSENRRYAWWRYVDLAGSGVEVNRLMINVDFKKLKVAGTDFHPVTTFNLPSLADRISYIYVYPRILKEGDPVIILNADKVYYYLSFGRNPLFNLKWTLYFGTFLIILLFISTLNWILKINIERRLALKSRLDELQLRTIKSQIDPHFIFNTLNSIGALINTEKKERAYHYMSSISRLLQSIVASSSSVIWTLEEEIAFVKDYIELEMFRFEDKFSYNLFIDEVIDQRIKFPKMGIQSFVENAIKHGIIQKEKDGLITLRLSKTNREVLIEITDNGIGRKAAGKYSLSSTHKGIEIMKNFYELYNQIHQNNISYEIIDLYNDIHEPTGTKVNIKIRNV